jgi:spermidine/putrescine transport system substrate-binding protein
MKTMVNRSVTAFGSSSRDLRRGKALARSRARFYHIRGSGVLTWGVLVMRRRSFAVRSSAIAAVAVLVLGACASDPTTPAATSTVPASPEPLGGTLVISNWDLYMPKSVVRDFEAETGVEVEYALHTTNEDIMGKLTASNGGGFDLVFVSGPFVEALTELGYAAAIDPAQIPNLANLDDEATQLAYDPGNTHSVPYTWGTTGLCYRSDLVSAPPTSWEVFRTSSPDTDQQMTMLGTDRWLLQPGLLSLGYSINTTNPDEIEAAKQWTMEAKPNLLAFDDTTFYAKLVSGEASVVQAWDGWCEYGVLEDPENIEFTIPTEGSDVWTDTMVVMESSQNKAAAHAFIDYILQPEVGKQIVEYTLYKMPNAAVMAAVDPAVLETHETLSISPSELFSQEAQTGLGEEGTILWVEAATEVKAG